jgi:hypothetical protein
LSTRGEGKGNGRLERVKGTEKVPTDLLGSFHSFYMEKRENNVISSFLSEKKEEKSQLEKREKNNCREGHDLGALPIFFGKEEKFLGNLLFHQKGEFFSFFLIRTKKVMSRSFGFGESSLFHLFSLRKRQKKWIDHEPWFWFFYWNYGESFRFLKGAKV